MVCIENQDPWLKVNVGFDAKAQSAVDDAFADFERDIK